MPLDSGSKLGVYEIAAPIGAGGMGEVYRAHDTKLEFLARVLIHVPEPNKHLLHFYGAYANRIRQH